MIWMWNNKVWCFRDRKPVRSLAQSLQSILKPWHFSETCDIPDNSYFEWWTYTIVTATWLYQQKVWSALSWSKIVNTFWHWINYDNSTLSNCRWYIEVLLSSGVIWNPIEFCSAGIFRNPPPVCTYWFLLQISPFTWLR